MSKRDVVLLTTKISGGWLIKEAREVFDGMPERSSVLWNALR